MPAPAYYAHLAAFHARVHVTNGKYEAFQVFFVTLATFELFKNKTSFIFRFEKKVEGKFAFPISKWLIFAHLYVEIIIDFCTHDFLGTCLLLKALETNLWNPLVFFFVFVFFVFRFFSSSGSVDLEKCARAIRVNDKMKGAMYFTWMEESKIPWTDWEQVHFHKVTSIFYLSDLISSIKLCY